MNPRQVMQKRNWQIFMLNGIVGALKSLQLTAVALFPSKHKSSKDSLRVAIGHAIRSTETALKIIKGLEAREWYEK